MTPPRRDPRRPHRHRYGPWQGGPDPLSPPSDLRKAVDALGDRVLAGDSVRDALSDLLRRGVPAEHGRRAGLSDLRSRAQRMRAEAARRGRLDGTITRAAALLDQAVATERDALHAIPPEDPRAEQAEFDQARLDALPSSVAQSVRELRDYDWTSPHARELYEQILQSLRSDVLDQQFAGLKDALADMNDADAAAAVNEMLSDLNDLLEAHARAEDTEQDFADFMAKHGHHFPENPRDVEELIDALARRAAAGERLMNSLPPGQRDELQQLMSQAINAETAAQMAQLGANLQALRPAAGWGGQGQLRGENPLGLGEATEALAEIADLDALLSSMAQEHPGATLDDVDVEAVQRTLGAGAAADMRALRQLERELREQGWLTGDRSSVALTPKAMRQLGKTALRSAFSHLQSGGRGQHDQRNAGAAGEVTGASRAWRFGDEQPLDVVRTIGNAVRREGARSGSRSSPGGVRLAVQDFEVVETERRSGATVALCVDLSFSMIAEGRWAPMKQTALALAHLVATQFPQDALQIIGFGRYACALSPTELAGIEPDYVQGTNLDHALQLAMRHLRRHPDGDPVVLVVTDGEPTAHLEGARAIFNWPPVAQTIEATVAAVDALTRYGAPINTFMLGEDQGLAQFMQAVARRNGGRVFTADPDRLGSYVVSDYLRSRQSRRAR